jgi:hypothetical protein
MGRSLLDVVIAPSLLLELDPSEQTEVIRQARNTGLLGFLEARIGADAVTGRLHDQLLSAKVHSDYNNQVMTWEINRLEEILAPLSGPVILLKGAAYKALDLEFAEGRLASDVDLLVPRDQLPEAEALLLAAGWETMGEDDYEQHYYREWMHELPPLRHEDRGTVVDLHHTILPLTARLKPDPEKLISSALPMASGPFYTLTPEDTVLHRATHLFYDGDLRDSLRELVDIHELITTYSTRQGFEELLAQRARALGLGKPLFYALYFCRKLLGTNVSANIVGDLTKDGNRTPIRQLLCFFMEKQLTAMLPDQRGWITMVSGWILFLRSHWIKMPVLLLARHLLTQIWRRGGIRTG